MLARNWLNIPSELVYHTLGVHLSIFLGNIFIDLLEVRRFKVPVARGEELQHFEAHRYLGLHTYHAGNK